MGTMTFGFDGIASPTLQIKHVGNEPMGRGAGVEVTVPPTVGATVTAARVGASVDGIVARWVGEEVGFVMEGSRQS